MSDRLSAMTTSPRFSAVPYLRHHFNHPTTFVFFTRRSPLSFSQSSHVYADLCSILVAPHRTFCSTTAVAVFHHLQHFQPCLRSLLNTIPFTCIVLLASHLMILDNFPADTRSTLDVAFFRCNCSWTATAGFIAED